MATFAERKYAGEAQKFLNIREIRGNVVVMKNRDLRAVVCVSSVNFSLKSVDEQEALVSQFQNFLNSVDFQLQIVVQSRKLNIDSYLQNLEERSRGETNELLIIQTQEYIEFVRNLVQISNIVSKMFYVVIPFSVVEKKGGVLHGVKQFFKPVKVTELTDERFKEYNGQLLQRANNIMINLSSIGLRSKLLDEGELIELYSSSFNPGRGALLSHEDINATIS